MIGTKSGPRVGPEPRLHSEPATKADLMGVRDELKQDIEQLHAETQHMYNDLVERIGDSETKLLSAFKPRQ